MRETEFGGYQITERPLANGWYELATITDSMGEVYRDSMRFDHKPSLLDYTKFVQRTERNR